MKWKEILKEALEEQGIEIDLLDKLDEKDEPEGKLGGYATAWRARGRKFGNEIEVVAMGYGTERLRESNLWKMPIIALGMIRDGIDVDWAKVTRAGFYGMLMVSGRGRFIQTVSQGILKRIIEGIDEALLKADEDKA